MNIVDKKFVGVLDMAASVYGVIDMNDILTKILPFDQNSDAMHARLLIAHLVDFPQPKYEDQCATVIARQTIWKELCSELIRYSAGRIASLKVLLAVLAQREPAHPLVKNQKGQMPTFSCQAYDALDDGETVTVRIGQEPGPSMPKAGFLVSTENPVDWYGISKDLRREGNTYKLTLNKGSLIRNDKQIVIRPSIFYTIS